MLLRSDDYEAEAIDQGPLSLETAAHDAAIADGLISSSKGVEAKGKKAGTISSSNLCIPAEHDELHRASARQVDDGGGALRE